MTTLQNLVTACRTEEGPLAQRGRAYRVNFRHKGFVHG